MVFEQLIGKTLKSVVFESEIIKFTDIDDNVYILYTISPTVELKIRDDFDINNILMSPIIEAYDQSDGSSTYKTHWFRIYTEKGGCLFDFYDYETDLCKFRKVKTNNVD